MPPLHSREAEQPDAAVLWRWVWASMRPYLGYVLVAIGFVLLVVAYFGVSREIFVARQIPYLVSGGLFGVAAVTLGSRLLLIEDLRRDSGRLDRLEQAVAELHQVLLTRPDAPSRERAQESGRSDPLPGGPSREDPNPDGAAPDRLVVLPGGESFHRPDCPVVAGKPSPRAVTPATAQRKGLRACPLCQPVPAGI